MGHQKVTAMMALASTAFETVDPDTLQYVLNLQFRISSSALEWFNSYLQPRPLYCVNIGQGYSKETPLDFLCASRQMC